MDNLYALIDAATGQILPVKGVSNGDGTSSLSMGFGGSNSPSLMAVGDGKTAMLMADGPTNYVPSAGNSSTVQLAAGATFTGAIESVYNSQAISVLVTSNLAGTLVLRQYIDAAGLKQVNAWTFNLAAAVPFSRSFTANGNFFKLTFQNTGASATTTLEINTAYGQIFPATNLGNVPVSLDEVGGTAVTLGQKTSALSLPVVLSSDQSQLQVASPAAMVTVSITRPADTTAYAAGDVVGAASAINSFASFGATGDNMLLTTAILRMDVAAAPSGLAAFRLHLYGASPTAVADNAVFNLVSGDRANYLGFVDLVAPTDLGDTLYSQNVQLNKHIKLAGTTLYAVLQTIGAFTPASAQVFSLSLGGVKL